MLIRPMLATPSERRVLDDGWLLERKLDGVRAIAERDGPHVRLVSRTGKPMADGYPELVAALAAQPVPRFTVDGEIVAFDEHGRTSFARLQRRMQLRDPVRAVAAGVRVSYFLFDLPALLGHDTTGLPLLNRKQLLRETVEFADPLYFTEHVAADGPVPLAEACARGWEGLVAKRADSRYVPRRSPDWLKLPCTVGQELVIGGFTEPAGRRTGFGALLVGHYEGGALRYAGKVGTGFDTALLHRLRAELDALVRPDPPFADPPATERRVHWVEPRLVARVAFTEWTREGRLRAPRFEGLRTDKRPEDVVRERPSDGPEQHD
ncbi:non-homologous end-joining DNA ligase [Kitasatospora sp. NPDC085879]|uniref:non-homologous end-joining DNA ligase n=1 Tax=Kitasatospora sp. NPDC085879 TaxID=3154769 RepID=UPI003447C28B